MTSDPPLDPTAAFRELGRIRLGDTDLAGVLDQVTHLAARSIPGAAEASVTLIRRGAAETAAHSGPSALAIDKWQYELGYGPCLDAAAGYTTIHVPDVSAEKRWPGWAPMARDAGIGSTLSVGLPIQEQVTGALNVYASSPDAFDEDAVGLAETFAGYAAVCLANAHLYETTTAFVGHLEKAMAGRAVIEQAKGIIMGQRQCTAEEAFAALAKASQDSHRKLREVATDLVMAAAAGHRGKQNHS
ncbi:GAF and ANTAR domain-containing protein [Actinoplanes sp. KI2]|uniref:GAF and ANTAR domain-containing protein n=1 Tax=Actinoplanes sp. KI2 TaxID=2983315 RepID=UPI0021D5C640|nr:GAF and ANTAR domain-containing protein [Actinoplanes sp. KI2]MCU7727989.1 GAF and ANTAR domain-containing protein [Actinoplanes sp. KI2]